MKHDPNDPALPIWEIEWDQDGTPLRMILILPEDKIGNESSLGNEEEEKR